jgi:alkanesulfonate monooxygenase SsuD/methylene tetrahydromethanopterin reductase-like flavin-dependent oxidoreductase (luciferase family)
MKIAFSLPLRRGDGSAHSLDEVMSIARTIEDAGFDGIWIGDAIGRGRIFPDPFQWLLAAAAATRRVDLGIAAYIVPLRNPVELSQRLLTMHALTRGRFHFGVGTGSNEADFKALGSSDWEERFKVLSRNLDVIRRICRGEKAGEADLMPWPNATPGPPVLVGAWTSKIWIRRAAREFEGWLASGGGPGGTTFKDMKDGLALYRAEGGKRAVVATVGVGLSETAAREPLGNDTRFTLRCHPGDALERIRAAEELGFDDVLLRKDDLTVADVIQVSELLGLARKRAAAAQPAE